MSPFKADIGYIPRLPLDLLAPGPRTPVSVPGTEYVECLVEILRMLRERMEETQLSMVTEVNERHQRHPFRIGDLVFLDTGLLPVGYANVNYAANDRINSRKFQHPYAGPFTNLRMVGENACVLDIPAHWRLQRSSTLRVSCYLKSTEHVSIRHRLHCAPQPPSNMKSSRSASNGAKQSETSNISSNGPATQKPLGNRSPTFGAVAMSC